MNSLEIFIILANLISSPDIVETFQLLNKISIYLSICLFIYVMSISFVYLIVIQENFACL